MQCADVHSESGFDTSNVADEWQEMNKSPSDYLHQELHDPVAGEEHSALQVYSHMHAILSASTVRWSC